MAAVGDLVKGVVSPILSVFDKPKAPKPVLPRPTATPRSNSIAADALSRRRGSAENQRTGGRGAESGTTAKKNLLGQ